MTLHIKCRFDVETGSTFRAGTLVTTLISVSGGVWPVPGGSLALTRMSPRFLGRRNATKGFSGIAERNLLDEWRIFILPLRIEESLGSLGW